MKYMSYLTWIIVALVVTFFVYNEMNFALMLVIAIALGLALNMLLMIVMVKLENNKAFLPGVVSRKKQMLPVMQENA
jgi:inorganic pyrophosphatase/exopolyphosphatase